MAWKKRKITFWTETDNPIALEGDRQYENRKEYGLDPDNWT